MSGLEAGIARGRMDRKTHRARLCRRTSLNRIGRFWGAIEDMVALGIALVGILKLLDRRRLLLNHSRFLGLVLSLIFVLVLILILILILSQRRHADRWQCTKRKKASTIV